MPKTKVFINGNDFSELVNDLVTSIEFERNYLIGNTPSKELTMKAINKNGEFNNMLDSPFILRREDGSKLGTFFVVKKPERMTKEINLTLYDSMYKANVEYVSDLEYPTTVGSILDDISSILGITIDYTEMCAYALNRVVNSYDSTEMIRTHLGWIAELGGGNFFSDEDGNYVFKSLSKNKQHDLPPDDVEQFDTYDDYLISGFVYSSDIFAIVSGNDEHNVYRIDTNNLYIESQEDLDNLNTLLSGMTFRVSNALKCSHIEGLQLGEIINVANEFNIMPLSIKQTYLNAVYDIQEISGEISLNDEEKISDQTTIVKRIRKVQANVDKVNNQIILMSESVEENYVSKTQLTLSEQGINTTISNTKTELEGKIKTIEDNQATYEQNATGFGATYVKQTQYEDDMKNLVTTGRLTKYFRYDSEYVENGQQTGALLIGYKDDANPTLVEAKISPIGFALLENNTKMLWIEQTQTYLKNATIEGALQIGLNNGLKLMDEDENGWSFTI